MKEGISLGLVFSVLVACFVGVVVFDIKAHAQDITINWGVTDGATGYRYQMAEAT